MNNLFVCYPKCKTCQKARKWLESHSIPYDERNIQMDNPTEQELRTWVAQSGQPLKKVFNTSGLLYRSLGLAKKLPDMSEDEQFAILATDGMLVKRPIFVFGNRVLFGFKEPEWDDCFIDMKCGSCQCKNCD